MRLSVIVSYAFTRRRSKRNPDDTLSPFIRGQSSLRFASSLTRLSTGSDMISYLSPIAQEGIRVYFLRFCQNLHFISRRGRSFGERFRLSSPPHFTIVSLKSAFDSRGRQSESTATSAYSATCFPHRASDAKSARISRPKVHAFPIKSARTFNRKCVHFFSVGKIAYFMAALLSFALLFSQRPSRTESYMNAALRTSPVM